MMIEKLNIVVTEMIFCFLKNEIDLFQHIQYQRIIFKILIENLREYHDVVDICESEISSIVTENDVHGSLKMSRSILQIKWHANIFSKSIFDDEDDEQSCARDQFELVIIFVTIQC